MKLSDLFRRTKKNQQPVKPSEPPPEGLTPEQEAAWQTMNPREKNEFLTDLLVTRARDAIAHNREMAARTDKILGNKRDGQPNTRPETRIQR